MLKGFRKGVRNRSHISASFQLVRFLVSARLLQHLVNIFSNVLGTRIVGILNTLEPVNSVRLFFGFKWLTVKRKFVVKLNTLFLFEHP
jgi:hypothetical protein